MCWWQKTLGNGSCLRIYLLLLSGFNVLLVLVFVVDFCNCCCCCLFIVFIIVLTFVVVVFIVVIVFVITIACSCNAPLNIAKQTIYLPSNRRNAAMFFYYLPTR